MQELIRLDETLVSPQERLALVQKIVNSVPSEKLSKTFLQKMADYLISAMTKEEKKSKKINTQNRLKTINKRETSFQGLSAKFQQGEDAIYSLITNDKNILFTPKISITQEDLDQIPALKELREAINRLQQKAKTATGKKLASIRHQLIQMRQDQYVIKLAYKKPVYCLNATTNFHHLNFYEDVYINKDLQIVDNSLISFMKPQHIAALLRNYSRLKQDAYACFQSDGYFLMESLDALVDKTLKDKFPLYYDLLIYKIDGKSNAEIQSLLERDHSIRHSVQYISSLWCRKIPKLISQQAQKDFLLWYFTEKERGRWKKCSRCGQIKLAHKKFFSSNPSSKDGFYSICKECRNKKKDRKGIIIKRIVLKS